MRYEQDSSKAQMARREAQGPCEGACRPLRAPRGGSGGGRVIGLQRPLRGLPLHTSSSSCSVLAPSRPAAAAGVPLSERSRSFRPLRPPPLPRCAWSWSVGRAEAARSPAPATNLPPPFAAAVAAASACRATEPLRIPVLTPRQAHGGRHRCSRRRRGESCSRAHRHPGRAVLGCRGAAAAQVRAALRGMQRSLGATRCHGCH